MDFISIIIPAFNAERWLENTLNSVRDAIDADCEVIIVNDGSTDRTCEIARRFADTDPRFTALKISHVGPNAARKAGFKESSGDYIMFVDSDDILPADSIKELRKLSETTPSDLTENKDAEKTRPKIIFANTFVRSGNDELLLLTGKMRFITGLEFATEILNRTITGFLPGHWFSRELLESIDWDDNPNITHQENYYLLLSLAMKLNEIAPNAHEVLVAPGVIAYRYIRRAGSQSSLMALTPKGLESVWRHLNNLGLPEPELTLWGIEALTKVFVERGIPFPNTFSVAADLRKKGHALGKKLPEEYRHKLEALGSMKMRTRIAREMARTAGLTSIIPHLSIIVLCNHNVAKVQRTVDSIFAMGFRNLEAIIVDMGCSHDERVALNAMTIRYARVRLVKVASDVSAFDAAKAGLNAAQGLCVALVRPGDLCCSEGLYDAVARIDYGADAVIPNYCEIYRFSRVKAKFHSYAVLRSTEEARNATRTPADFSENVYEKICQLIEDKIHDKLPFFLYGIVWRTDFIKAQEFIVDSVILPKDKTISLTLMEHIMRRPVTIVTQDRTAPPAFEVFVDGPITKMITKMTSRKKRGKS